MLPHGYRTCEDLENVSEAQVDEKIIPAITDLDVPLFTSSRLKKLIKAIQEAAEVSWESRKGTVEDEDVPLPSGELKRSGSLFAAGTNCALRRQRHRKDSG